MPKKPNRLIKEKSPYILKSCQIRSVPWCSPIRSVPWCSPQKRIDEFKALWTSAVKPNEQNRAFKLLIEKIVYDREDSGLRLEVLYK